VNLVLPRDIEEKASAGDAEAQFELGRRLEAEGEGDAAMAWFRRAAQSGHVEAKAVLGYRLLAYPPYAVEEGTLWTASAASDGSADAAHLMAVLVATGLGVPQSWPTALVYLQRSAEFGHALGRRELIALSADAALKQRAAAGAANSPDIWRQLRESVDIAAWLKVPPPRTVFAKPRIVVIEGFASAEICDWLIERARPRLKRAAIYDQQDGQSRADKARTNSDSYFSIPDSDLILLFVRARIAAVTGLPTGGMEAASVMHYDVGQVFEHHYDYLDPGLPGYSEELALGGQRLATFLLYMNDDYEAAETDFPRIGWKYRGRKGDAMFFSNVDASGEADPLTLHAGLAPTRGQKWLLSQWIRARVGLG